MTTTGFVDAYFGNPGVQVTKTLAGKLEGRIGRYDRCMHSNSSRLVFSTYVSKTQGEIAVLITSNDCMLQTTTMNTIHGQC